MRKKEFFSRAYLLVLTLTMYLPLVLVVIYSFNASKISSRWDGLTLRWYGKLFRNRAMFEALINSLILAVTASLGSGIIGTLGAYGFTRVKMKSQGVMETMTLLPIMTPEIILGVVFMAFFSLIGLPFGMTTLILSHMAFCTPYVYLTVKARLRGMDETCLEAARDLGAGEMRAFFDITLPMLRPAILSGMVLSFAMSFDDVIISIFVTGVRVNTLPIKIYTQLKTGVSPEINALSSLMLLFTGAMVLLSYILSRKKGSESYSRRLL